MKLRSPARVRDAVRPSPRVKICYEKELQPLERRAMLSAAVEPIVIEGAQPAAFDQPRIHVLFQRPGAAGPLSSEEGGQSTFQSQFLDTGSSGIVLSSNTAAELGITSEQFNGGPVTFTDIGVAGGEEFDVSETLGLKIAPFRSLFDFELDEDQYTGQAGPLRAQVSRGPLAEPDDFLNQPIDIIGMPAIAGKVMVMDPKPVNDISDGIRTYLYAPGTPFNPAAPDSDPGIPSTNLHVRLSYGAFGRFTTTEPAGAAGPTISPNPFIGPNPVNTLDPGGPMDNTPPVKMTNGGSTARGSFLLDTGAAASFISQGMASQLHVHYKPGTFGTDDPRLVDDAGVLVPNQYVLPIGGVGGAINIAGFYAESLSIPTKEGVPIVFTNAPVGVLDITVTDPNTGDELTIDGDFGMNFLTASTSLEGLTGGGLLTSSDAGSARSLLAADGTATATVDAADLGGASAGPWDWVTFDAPNGILGLQLADFTPPEVPPTASIHGTAYNDADASGAFTAGETGLAGVTVYLDANDNAARDPGEASVVTGAGGAYSFGDLEPGTYVVRQAQMSTHRATGPLARKHTVTLDAGDDAAGGDFFDTARVRVQGIVFNDVNGNGVQNAGEGAQPGWTVFLDANKNGARDAAERLTVTDANGYYAFDNLPANVSHRVREVLQSGWRRSSPPLGYYDVTLPPANVANNRNFSNTKRALVSGTVYNDKNNNGQQNAGEAGLGGWRVFLDTLKKNGVLDPGERSVLTDSGGNWSFGDLLPGTYRVAVVGQSGWTKKQPAGGIYTLTVGSAGSAVGKLFGVHKN